MWEYTRLAIYKGPIRRWSIGTENVFHSPDILRMTGSRKRKVNQYLDPYLEYRDVRKCKDEQNQSAGAEHDAEPVKFAIVLDQIFGYRYGGHDDEDHTQRGLEDEYVPPAALQGAEEARGEEPEDEPDGLAGCEDGYGAVFERPAEIATEDAHACRATGVRRTHGQDSVETRQTYPRMSSSPHLSRAVPS